MALLLSNPGPRRLKPRLSTRLMERVGAARDRKGPCNCGVASTSAL